MQQPRPTEASDLPESATPTEAKVGTPDASTGLTPGRSFSFPSFTRRRNAYLFDLLGPGAFVGPTIQAALDQAKSLKVAYPPDGFNAPGLHPAHGAVPEWGQGALGYSKRYASNFGLNLVGTTSRYGLGEILREDVTYHPCACSGILLRASHAIGQAFVARTKSGRMLPSVPALVSPYVASEVAVNAWYPSRYNASDALRISAPLYLGIPLKNLIAEFLGR